MEFFTARFHHMGTFVLPYPYQAAFVPHLHQACLSIWKGYFSFIRECMTIMGNVILQTVKAFLILFFQPRWQSRLNKFSIMEHIIWKICNLVKFCTRKVLLVSHQVIVYACIRCSWLMLVFILKKEKTTAKKKA